MIRLAAILALVCSGCAFDAGVDVDESFEDEPGTTDPADEMPEDQPGTEDPPVACVDQTFTLEVRKDFDPDSEFLPDEHDLTAPHEVELPRDLEVATGSPGNTCAYLDLHLAGVEPVRCGFLGTSSGGGEGFGDGFGGGGGGGFGGGGSQDYDFVECRQGGDASFDFCGGDNQGQVLNLEPNDFVVADRVVMIVENDSEMGTTVISVDLTGVCL